MDADSFDSLTRAHADGSVSRRATLKVLALGGVASLFGRFAEDAEAATCKGKCAGRNWCENRTHTCGPQGGYGKCLVRRFGSNFCGEILFQANSCADCRPANCTNCICILGAGGGDKCNNGPNGMDYVCVRKV